MDYDLSRLSTRTFEQLIQSLAYSVVGPGIVIFGDGPDGGREATFEGKIAFPNNAERWQGYGVVQAKFKQRPEGSGKDGDWALQELKDELKKFTSAASKLKKPEYYIFATNVVLTPVAEAGGKDRLTRYLESQKVELGLKDFRIWDYDQLRVMLDSCADVRTTYAAWITAGDVLAELIKTMQPQRHDFREVMTGYLQKELCADQYVNLNQAGHQPKDRIPLAQVFVDLPTGDQHQPDGAIAGLLDIGSWNLSPKATPHEALVNLRSSPTLPGRVVFIGGPGQGKTTLSQFLCQLHRVALLDMEDRQLISPEARAASALIIDQIAHEGLVLPSMPRFPVRIVLNSFAADLAAGRTTSLFVYLLRRIEQLSERTLTTDDLRSWLKAYPWLIVLDGLDEVPVSSNREQVIDSVQNFLIDAQACNADLLLVATTRPQGYNNDFSPAYYRHFELLPLDVPRALHYADRLLEQRWGGDRDKIDILKQRLQRAGEEEATARLMRSPLQVTIMAMLVENVGQPPRERWRLFNDYYRVIYNREQQRDIPAAELLNSYKADIDAIHQRVGLRLQAISEHSGGTDALLPNTEFAELIKQRLESEGHTGQDGERLQADIVNASIDRLVFLVAPQADKVGFEIRSLQEFMAAECLMRGSDQDVSQRLRAIAPAAHWRNVFLFAAGRCFHERQHLRDTLYTLCCELNEGEGVDGGELEKATLAGSRLALEILEDGALAKAPGQLKLFANLALRLLELPPCEEQTRLGRQYISLLEESFRNAVLERLKVSIFEQQLGAWRLLLYLDSMGENWARDILTREWPHCADNGIEIIKSGANLSFSERVIQSGRHSVLLAEPSEELYFGFTESPEESTGGIGRIFDYIGLKDFREMRVGGLDVEIAGIDKSHYLLNIIRIGFEFNFIYDEELFSSAHYEWKWIVKAFKFCADIECSKDILFELLSSFPSLSSNCRTLIERIKYKFSWPLEACLLAAKYCDTSQLLLAISQGELGDREDWLAAQHRWETCGLTELDFVKVNNWMPFDKSIGKVGYPFNLGGGKLYYRSSILDTVVDLYNTWSSIPISNIQGKKGFYAHFLFALSGIVDSKEVWVYFEQDNIRELCDYVGDSFDCDILNAIPETFLEHPDFICFFEKIGEKKLSGQNTFFVNILERMFLNSSNSYCLLPFLAYACENGYKPCQKLYVDPDNLKETRYYIPSIVIMISKGDWLSSASQVDDIIKNTSLNNEFIRSILEIISSHSLIDMPVVLLLKRIYELLPANEWRQRRDVLQAMLEQQRHRQANVAVLPV